MYNQKEVRKMWKSIICFVCIIFIAGTLYAIFVPKEGITFNIGDDMLVIYHSKTKMNEVDYINHKSIYYEDIVSVNYLEEFDYGEMVEGEVSRKCSSGVWENDLYGEYFLLVLNNVSSCVVIETSESEHVVFNVESSAATESFAEALNELLVDKGVF